MNLYQARDIAIPIVKKLESLCDFVSIAGSIRREKFEVKDIEIVALPKEIIIGDLFGENKTSKRIPQFAIFVKELGKILKGKPEDGRYVQILLPDRINLDLFIPQRHDLVRQFAIRTGSSAYAHKILTAAWNRLGWVGTDDGLRLEKECIKKKTGVNPVTFKDKFIWICNKQNPTLPPVWENEYELFHWLGGEWIEPKNRIV